MKRALFLALLMSLAASPSLSQSNIYANDGTFLGNTGNQYNLNSINNPYGKYGSRYSLNSMNNPYSTYGSRYSMQSPNNPYAQSGRLITPTGQSYKFGGSGY